MNKVYCKGCDYLKNVKGMNECIHESNIEEGCDWYEKYPIFKKAPAEINKDNDCKFYNTHSGYSGLTSAPSLENLGYDCK